MKTAFVVLTYNRSDALLAVLRSLAPQCGPHDVVVVADDGSRPEQVRALRQGLPRFACPVRHAWHPDTGFTAARARNLGALQAGADYIVFMDGDCVPNPRFAAMHRALAAPGHFVNGSRVLLSQALSEKVAAQQVDLAGLQAADWLRLRLAGDVNKLTHLLHWPGAPGRVEPRFRWKGIRSCNFGVWYRDLEAVNGFDESFQGWGHEDADLVLRLHHHGSRRKNGFLATEVFHLWHNEHSRSGEAANRARVQERQRAGTVRAAIGLAEAARSAELRAEPLN
jgi:GT2 family glycosyltransferase